MAELLKDLPDLPTLSDEECRNLIENAQAGDNQALELLVKHNLKLVMKIVYRFKNTSFELQDLFQTGVIGLIKAINNFDLTREVKLSTYAFSRIIGEIRVFMRDDDTIHISRTLKNNAKKIKKLSEEIRKKYNREPELDEIIEITGLSKEEIFTALNAMQQPASLDQTITNNEEDSCYLSDFIESKVNDAEQEVEKMTLFTQLKNLSFRERKIIYLRYFKDLTQQEIGQELQLSQVQISRLEKKIINKLHQKLSNYP